MATLTPTLTLVSTDAASDELNFSVTDTLTVKAPARGLSTVVATATGSQSVIIPASTAIAYLFIRHTGTTDGSTDTVRQVDVENTDDEAFARLSAGEWMFIPFNHAEASIGVQLHVQHSSPSDVVQMEYAYWTKS
jgi:ribosome-associated toxin RatA of RatAB toxin-antitoxin module